MKSEDKYSILSSTSIPNHSSAPHQDKPAAMRPFILAALATAATAQLNFTDPDPSKPLNFGEPTIYIAWTVAPDSKYAPLGTSASLYFKGPQNLDYLVSPIHTGQGVTGQSWMVKEFLDTKNHTFTVGEDYYFELRF